MATLQRLRRLCPRVRSMVQGGGRVGLGVQWVGQGMRYALATQPGPPRPCQRARCVAWWWGRAAAAWLPTAIAACSALSIRHGHVPTCTSAISPFCPAGEEWRGRPALSATVRLFNVSFFRKVITRHDTGQCGSSGSISMQLQLHAVSPPSSMLRTAIASSHHACPMLGAC